MKKLIKFLPIIVALTLSCVVATAKNNKGSKGYKHKDNLIHQENMGLKENHKYKKRLKHSKKLPPGLQKKIARGKELPPGWQKKIIRGEVLDIDIYEYSTPVDYTKHPKIFPGDPATEVIKIHNKIIRIMRDSHEIKDILQ